VRFNTETKIQFAVWEVQQLLGLSVKQMELVCCNWAANYSVAGRNRGAQRRIDTRT